ncbi:RGS domain-containing protein [Obelidium mucronatum]|nr:RGS domain-containing protein [Obelidium mucronatum]
MLRLSSFPNFYKQAIEKGPITLKYTLQQVLDDTLHPPVSLKDFHNFLVRDHSEENIEFYIAFRRYQAMCDKVPAPVLTGQSKEVPDSALFEACKNALSDIIARFVSPKAPQELNVPRNLRNTVIAETEKRNIHPEIFKEVLENVVTMLKLSSFPKFQKGRCKVQVNVDDSIAVKSPGTLTAPNEIPEDVKNLILEIADTSSRVSITHRILTRLGLTSFVFDDPTDSSSTRDRISSFWKVSGEANSDVQFADMVTPAQLKLGLQQTLDDKIPPPLSCRDFRTYLKKEKKAHYVDFYLAVKKYRRLCEKVPEGILNNPSNASVTSPTQLPANSPIARIKTELNEIISKYCEPESKFYVQLTPQIKLFLNSEVNKNGNWTPHIFEGAINHVCMTMQRSSFPGFYKMATTKAKGVKLKIVGTKKTSKGVNVEARISEEVKEGDDEERDDLLDIEAPESLTAGKLSNLLFQVLADKTSPPLSRNDFYLYLKKEHSEENFDFYMSIVNYRKICKTGDQDDIKLAAYKIIETFLLSNGNREICITSKVKTAILKSVETDNNFDPNIFNAAFLEVLSILRVSSFPSFIS